MKTAILKHTNFYSLYILTNNGTCLNISNIVKVIAKSLKLSFNFCTIKPNPSITNYCQFTCFQRHTRYLCRSVCLNRNLSQCGFRNVAVSGESFLSVIWSSVMNSRNSVTLPLPTEIRPNHPSQTLCINWHLFHRSWSENDKCRVTAYRFFQQLKLLLNLGNQILKLDRHFFLYSPSNLLNLFSIYVLFTFQFWLKVFSWTESFVLPQKTDNDFFYSKEPNVLCCSNLCRAWCSLSFLKFLFISI